MNIRPDQMTQMADAMQHSSVKRMIAHLRATFPEATRSKTEAEMRSFVQSGISRAAPYDVKAEADVQRFLEYMMMYGPEFDTHHDWARKILTTQGVSGKKKMDWIDDYDQFVLNR